MGSLLDGDVSVIREPATALLISEFDEDLIKSEININQTRLNSRFSILNGT